MRLTLRTLLAYLDDTLEPAQAKLIGQKVAESDQARELVEHIKAVTRRRRITTPPTTGPGSKIDPNTIAEYLDNAVTPEQASEVEQICLASDVHLAEVAACHQILALVLGEPSPVPPSAKQRMYALVKGPEAIPFRKPPVAQQKKSNHFLDNAETDDTLRMGLPPVGGGAKWSQRFMLFGAGVLAASLLVLAIWQTLNLPGTSKTETPAKGDQALVAQGGGDTKKPPEKDKPKEEPKKEPKIEDDSPLPPPPKVEDTVEKGAKVTKGMTDVPDHAYAAPDNRALSQGKYVSAPAKDASVIVYNPVDRAEWRRLFGKSTDVQSGQTYVALPGCRGELQLGDVNLKLWGAMPEILPVPPLMESMIDLHNPKAFDVDLTLRRGRIVLTSQRADKPVTVRIRYENPTMPKELEHTDLVLHGKGAQLLIDRWMFFSDGEPFYKDPKHANRIGPAAGMGYWVLKGDVLARFGDVSYTMPGPPGRTFLIWNSLKGLAEPQVIKTLPDVVRADPPAPEGMDPKFRDDMLKARDYLHTLLSDKAVDVGLASVLDSKDQARRIMAVRCFAAVDDLGDLVDGLANKDYPEIRQAAIRGLQYWIACGRDYEYKLYEQLKTRYKVSESDKIMELMHGFPSKNPEHLDILVDYLNSKVLVIREMAYMHLFAMVEAGRAIPYDPTSDESKRTAAQKAWYEAIRKTAKPAKPAAK